MVLFPGAWRALFALLQGSAQPSLAPEAGVAAPERRLWLGGGLSSGLRAHAGLLSAPACPTAQAGWRPSHSSMSAASRSRP